MATVMGVYRFLDGKAPFSTQMSFDNAGFLVGHGDKEVHTILVALDITETVVEEAAQAGADLIVSHHPVIFLPARHITDQDPSGRKLLALLEHNIAAICAHTNLDIAPGGVNDALAQALGLEQIGPFSEDGLGRIGIAAGAPSAETFAAQVKERLAPTASALWTEAVRSTRWLWAAAPAGIWALQRWPAAAIPLSPRTSSTTSSRRRRRWAST